MARTQTAVRGFRLNGGKSTTAALQPEFWIMLEEIAVSERKTVREIVQQIEQSRGEHCRAAAIRLFILNYFFEKSANRKTAEDDVKLGASNDNQSARRLND